MSSVVTFPGGATATTKVEFLVQSRYVRQEGAEWRLTGYGPFVGEGGEQAAVDLVNRANADEEADDYGSLKAEYRVVKKTTTTTMEAL